MKKSGFTLVELLAVIIVISIITLITTINVFKYINSSKNEISKADSSSIISAAKNWSADNYNLLPMKDSDEQYILPVTNLIDEGYLTEDAQKYESFHVIIEYKDNQYTYSLKS